MLKSFIAVRTPTVPKKDFYYSSAEGGLEILRGYAAALAYNKWSRSQDLGAGKLKKAVHCTEQDPVAVWPGASLQMIRTYPTMCENSINSILEGNSARLHRRSVTD